MKKSSLKVIHDHIQFLHVVFDNGLEAHFMGPPLPDGYGKIRSMAFSQRQRLPDDVAIVVTEDGATLFVNPKDIEDDTPQA